jgi:formylglycine-generating enzyme required for sulfatase activity/tRNA A-37 threonylcarbamoyl transferase component Bud32
LSKLEAGTVFGRDFRIVRLLREGGMGAVYIADQLSTGKQRALKLMAPELAVDPGTRDRFVLEARAASKIESDHVVEVVTAGVDEASGSPYLVMELLRGEELADAAARIGPLPLGDVADVMSQVGHALEQAHMQGIVHRDLKPENIFLAASRRRDVAFTAKILDFGIAKLVEDSRQKTGTQPLGTPLFMAPEQTDRRGRICAATDVWALGLIAFKLITGRDFWVEVDGSLAMLFREICLDPIPFASVRATQLAERPLLEGEHPVPALPPGFDAWFARCVVQNVDGRYQDAGEAVRAFLDFVGPEAARGALVARSGEHGTTGGAVTGQVTGRGTQPPVSVRPSQGPVDVRAPTGVLASATAAPVLQTTSSVAPAQKGSSVGIGIAVGVVALAAGSFLAYRTLRGGPPEPPPAQPAAVTRATATAGPKASVAAAAPGTCGDGMVLIPAGKMFMGARDLSPNTRPPHEVSVGAYCLDKTEVTTRAYLACVEKGECERPPEKVSWPGIKDAQVKLYSSFCNASAKDRLDHPINCVAWPMAQTFCAKRGARLPTEAEWEFAARGASQRKYPWGDDPPAAKFLNACDKSCAAWFEGHAEKKRAMYDEDDGFVGTAPVGSFPAGASASGVLDLAGNVWEWTADWFGLYADEAAVDPKGPPTGTQRVVRGGDFTGSEADWARPAYRWRTEPDTYNHAIGFRCAATPK